MSVTITDAAWTQLVAQAAEQVGGIRVRRRGIGRSGDEVSLQIAARYGIVLPAAAREVQARVAAAVRTMCGVELSSVDVAVEELDE
jgi:Asp23 family, cell envelope-related function